MEKIAAKSIVLRTKSTSWFGTEYNMNLYRGCTHGCIYCDSRSDCYRNMDFDTVKAKDNCLRIVRDELNRKVKKGVVATGSMSDPYNPFEKDECLTRHALELLNAYGFGVAVATKSPLVARDTDIFLEIKEHSPVIIKMTVTTADDSLCRMLEPNVAPSSERFAAIRRLASAGLFCGILLMPLLPFINDNQSNILGIVEMAKEAGANFIYPGFGVTLRDGQREYFYERLDRLFPGTREKFQKRYGSRYSCGVPDAKKLFQVFRDKCDEYGILYKMQDIVAGYRMGYSNLQLSLFD